MTTTITQGNSAVITVAAGDYVYLNNTVASKARIEITTGAGAGTIVKAYHAGRAQYGPFYAGTVTVSAIVGSLEYGTTLDIVQDVTYNPTTGQLSAGNAGLGPTTQAISNTNASGTAADTTLTVTYSPTAATTQQQTSHDVETNYSSTNAISPGGWMVSYKGSNAIVSNAAIDKSVVYTAYTAVVGGAQVSKALGFEAVVSGLDATSNITQYASFYSANLAAIPNIDRIAVFYAFANDWLGASIKNVGRYLKAVKTSDGSKLREVAPARHPGYVTSRYYGPSGQGALTPVAVGANLIYTIPFHCAERTTFTKIGFRITTGISGNARVGIYYAEAGIPTDLIVDSGNVSTAATGAFETTISTTLEVGYYFLCFHASAAVTINWCNLSDSRAQMGTTTDNGDESIAYGSQAYAALPATFPAVSWANQSQVAPFVWLRK